MTSSQLQSENQSLKRYYYKAPIREFLHKSQQEILGELTSASRFSVETTQVDAWAAEIATMQACLVGLGGHVYFEYSIPRMGRRIDVLAIIGSAVFVIEFKVGATEIEAHAIDQVWDYALDLKNFHEPSHPLMIAPILVATNAPTPPKAEPVAMHGDRVLSPIPSNLATLANIIREVLDRSDGAEIDPVQWELGRYKPTPTIVEAAKALYRGHTVEEIRSNAAKDANLGSTSGAISGIIRESREKGQKSICLVTGVPGSGKTLVGLSMATEHMDPQSALYSVFLSGNDPLVAVLREALTLDKVAQERELGRTIRKKDVRRGVEAFIQNVRHFRDEGLRDPNRPPVEHVALFDEAQRAWTLAQTANFMQRKRHISAFGMSEPEFLISCMDRHEDWAVVVCLIGGGQEINTGEAGISEWIDALNHLFPDWRVFISSRLSDSEYAAGAAIEALSDRANVTYMDDLHLSVSMRSFRAENVSLMVKQLLDLDEAAARRTLAELIAKYPVVITRDLQKAKHWLKGKARGSQRYGIMVSSQAERLRPHAIFVKSPMDPVHWFLDGKEDIRSSYYLEDVATEFDVQGLELDWVCVTWDADFRYSEDGWRHWSFRGTDWRHIRASERQRYLKNAYRVLLTRARQGMVIVVPPGDDEDPTRRRQFYDPTYEYLQSIGFSAI
jgi:hypothetical protein